MLAFAMREPSARRMLRIIRRMNVSNMRPDYMYVRNATGTYDRVPDYGAWNFSMGKISCALIRHGEDDWSIHS
jgi:hypothetical protein